MSPAQRRLLEAVRDGEATYDPVWDRWTIDRSTVNCRTAHALMRDGLLDDECNLTQAGREALERET